MHAFGARLTSLVTPSTRNLYYSARVWGRTFRAENALFPGFSASLLVGIGLALAARQRWRGLSRWDRGMFVVGAGSLLLCFPAVYLPLSRIVPGLAGMRVPSRFYAVSLLPIAWLAGRGVDALLASSRTRRWHAAAWALCALLLVESTPRRLEWVKVAPAASYPIVYHWLARRPEVAAVVELPFAPDAADEIPRMLYQTLHGKPLANGYSGYLPPSFTSLQRGLGWPLRRHEQLELLRRRGISHIVVSRWRRGAPDPRGKLAPLPAELTRGPTREAELVYADETHLVYRVMDARAGRPP